MKTQVILITYEFSGQNRVEEAGIFKQNQYNFNEFNCNPQYKKWIVEIEKIYSTKKKSLDQKVCLLVKELNKYKNYEELVFFGDVWFFNYSKVHLFHSGIC